jgi:hypothetical protein
MRVKFRSGNLAAVFLYFFVSIIVTSHLRTPNEIFAFDYNFDLYRFV